MPLALVVVAIAVWWTGAGEQPDRRGAMRRAVEASWIATVEGGDPSIAFGQSDPALCQMLRECLRSMADAEVGPRTYEVEVVESAPTAGRALGASHQALLRVGERSVEIALLDSGGDRPEVIGVSVR